MQPFFFYYPYKMHRYRLECGGRLLIGNTLKARNNNRSPALPSSPGDAGC